MILTLARTKLKKIFFLFHYCVNIEGELSSKGAKRVQIQSIASNSTWSGFNFQIVFHVR